MKNENSLNNLEISYLKEFVHVLSSFDIRSTPLKGYRSKSLTNIIDQLHDSVVEPRSSKG